MQEQKTMAMYAFLYYYTVRICRYSNVLQGNIHVRVQVLRKSVCISSANSPHLLDVFYIYTIYYIYIYVY